MFTHNVSEGTDGRDCRRRKNFSFHFFAFPLKQMFRRIKDEKPEVLAKIVPVFGDITQENLGLNEEHLRMVLDESELVFHMAASLKLEATLKANIQMNLMGTKHVIEMCKRMAKLKLLMHLSTAFCTSDEKDVLYERVYDWKDEPREVMKCAEWMDEKTMEGFQSKILHPHPNTYTYTKRLAELFVRSEYDSIPVCIVRPSIGKYCAPSLTPDLLFMLLSRE
jgi:fatty acyl-CoA reductase